MMRVAAIFLFALMVSGWSLAYGKVDETMVLALSFDDGRGAIAKDSSQYGFDGKVEGAEWVDGRFGKALEFDGEGGDIVIVDDKPELLLLEGGTFMAWVYIMTEAGHASWPRILIKSNTNGGTNGYDFIFDRANAYSIRFCIGGINDAVACTSYPSSPVETDSWHHVAVTFDGETIKAYADGEEVGETAQANPAMDTTGSDLHIGNGVAADRPYHGILDEIRIWDRPLEQDEIQWQMQRSTNDVVSVEPRSKLATTWAEVKSEFGI